MPQHGGSKQQQRLGDLAGARRLAQQYLARYPRVACAATARASSTLTRIAPPVCSPELTPLWFIWFGKCPAGSGLDAERVDATAGRDRIGILPAQLHLTLPEAWCKRRMRVPDGVVLHCGDVAESERRWFWPVPATAPLRTLEDCAADHLPPELLRGAALDALARGLVTRRELAASGIDFARRRQLEGQREVEFAGQNIM